jgi:hypothetical protein
MVWFSARTNGNIPVFIGVCREGYMTVIGDVDVMESSQMGWRSRV